MHCLNCSTYHLEEVLLCKACRLPLWNLIAMVQKCGVCGQRLSQRNSECNTCNGSIIESAQVSVPLQPKINKEISASTIFIEAEDEKLQARKSNRRIKVFFSSILLFVVIIVVWASVRWIQDPYYFYETYHSLRSRWFGG